MAKDKVYMKGFKGFGPGMVCEPNSEHRKEYKENTTYEEEGGKICGSGVMHFCENPLDVLSFYPPVNDSGELNEYATVEALAPVESDEKKEKSCTKKLHIGVKLSLNELLKAAIDFTWSKVDKSKEQTIIFRQQSSNSGDYSVSSNSGNYSVSSNSGNYSGDRECFILKGEFQTRNDLLEQFKEWEKPEVVELFSKNVFEK